MTFVCIYGDEELNDEARDLVERLTNKTPEEYLEDLCEMPSNETANRFVDTLSKLDYLWSGDDTNF